MSNQQSFTLSIGMSTYKFRGTAITLQGAMVPHKSHSDLVTEKVLFPFKAIRVGCTVLVGVHQTQYFTSCCFGGAYQVSSGGEVDSVLVHITSV